MRLNSHKVLLALIISFVACTHGHAQLPGAGVNPQGAVTGNNRHIQPEHEVLGFLREYPALCACSYSFRS